MSVTKDAGFPVTKFDTADGSTNLAWTSFNTPGTNRYLVAVFMGNGASTNAILTLTSPNLTWTNRLAIVTAGNTYRVEIWTAFAASVVTGEIITSGHILSGCSYSRRSVIVFSLDGSESVGFGNSNSNNAITTDPSLAITATAAGSYLVAGFPYRSSGADTGVDGNTTSEYDRGGGGGFGFNERAGSRASVGAGSVTLGWTGDDPFEAYAIAGIEVKAAAGGGGPVLAPFRTSMGGRLN